MRLPTKLELIITVISLSAGCLIGSTFGPKQVEVREKVVTKTVSDTERTRDRDVVRVKEKRPDGTEVIRTEIKDRTQTSVKTNQTTDRESEKVVTRGAGVGVRFMTKGGLPDPTYGLGIDKNFIGPFRLGAVGFTDKTFGISLGMEF